MAETTNPAGVHPPLGRYSHMVKVPPGAEWLVVAGQVGVDPGGRVASGARAQFEQAFRNILTCLEAGGMGRQHLVKLTVLLTDPRFIEDYRAARSAVMGDETVPASTLMIVAGLAAPDLLVEIEAMAAKA